MNKDFVFRNGLPYGPDLRKLDEVFPVPELTEGLTITHEKLEKVVGLSRQSSRYYALINSWVSHKKSENAIILVWESKVGLRVLDPSEILDHAEKRTRQKIRQTGRAVRLFGWVDRSRLDDVGKSRLDHQMRIATALASAMDSAKKQLAVELAPAKSLPRAKFSGDQT